MLVYNWTLLILSVFLSTINTEEILSGIITLYHGGQIQGHELRSYRNQVFYAFQEIPYAIPPVHHLRFKEASEALPWSEVLKTTRNTKICTQLLTNDPRETEDCLYLNVYTPANLKNITTLLPVYFYIHGGYFYEGDGTVESFGPQFLMDYGIVVVTINYRLGAFGFLSTGDDVIPGNFGFKDQNLALKWVHKNINRFGGDPNKITIGGQSAGAGSVGHHVLSARSKGLFRAAILESGSPLCSKMFAKRPKYFAYELGKLLDRKFSPCNSSYELLGVLQQASVQDIKTYSNLPIPESYRNAVGNEANTVWNPVEEFQENGFVKHSMHENFKNGQFNKVPIMIGFNSEEEIAFDLDLLKTKSSYLDSNNTYLINGNLNIKPLNKFQAGNKLKRVYTNKTFVEDFPALIKFVSDAKYTTGICRLAELASKYTDIFFYQFSYDGLLGSNNKSVTGAPGVGHYEENHYLFQDSTNYNINKFPVKDLMVQEQLLLLWTNFIKYLNPLPVTHGMLTGYGWPQMTEKNFVYLNINSTWNFDTNPRQYQRWKEIYTQYAEEFQYTY